MTARPAGPGHDLANARLAPPPLDPVPAGSVDAGWLADAGARLARRTWAAGLPTWSWGEGVCLLGLVRLARAQGLPVPAEVLAWLDRHCADGVQVDHVNHLAPGAVLAMALLERPSAEPVLRDLLAWFDGPAASRDARGTLEHWPGGIWADTVMMAGTFLGHAGLALGEPSRVRQFAEQVVLHADSLQDTETGLYVHGTHHGDPVRCFWGRANAWTALASVELLELTARDDAVAAAVSDLLPPVREALGRQLAALAAVQPAHGVWSVLVDDHPEVAGVIETSAAAGIGAAMLRAGEVLPDLPDDVRRAGWLAVRGALAYLDDDGTLTRTSAGTVLQLIPFGYSVIRDDRIQPWGQGLALLAVAAALDALSRGRGPA